MLNKLLCKVLGHKPQIVRTGKKFVTFVCPRCGKQTRNMIIYPTELAVASLQESLASAAPTTLGGTLPTPDDEFIAKAKAEWNHPRKPWPEEKGAGQ